MKKPKIKEDECYKGKYVILLYRQFGSFEFKHNCLLLEYRKIDEQKHKVWGKVLACKLNSDKIINSYDEELAFGKWVDYLMFDDLESAEQRFMLEVL